MKAVRPLKWGSLPANEVGRISQHVMEGEGRKDGKDGVRIKMTVWLSLCLQRKISANESNEMFSWDLGNRQIRRQEERL